MVSGVNTYNPDEDDELLIWRLTGVIIGVGVVSVIVATALVMLSRNEVGG